MCRQLVLLAKNELRQMVFTCEHGTIHLSHQQTTLCLGWADFLRFADWILEGHPFVGDYAGSWHLHESSDGQLELWLGSGGIRLTVIEFFALSDLLRTARERLRTTRMERVSRPQPGVMPNISLN